MNKPVAWVTKKALDDLRMPLISEITLRIAVKSKNTDPFNIPLYTHPVKDREKDRLRFSDEAFNRWLDECISDSGHTVYDLVENVCEAWHGWENSQYYTHPVKELTQQEIDKIENSVYLKTIAKGKPIGSYGQELIKAILKKAQER